MTKFTHDLLVTLGFKSQEFTKGAKQSEGALDGLNAKFDDLGGVAKAALTTGVVGGAVMAGKAIYELGKRGADVIQTGESFELLKEKIGLVPDILQRLQQESKGTIDDMTLMSSTATLLAGTGEELGKQLGDATPQLMRIAKAANKLNPALGSTAHMYESIATGIKRASPMILDNLGLTVKIGLANEKYAKSLGKTVEQLTAEEKQLALLNATLEAGDNLLMQVGGTTDSAADDIARMETQVANLKDELAKAFAPAVSAATGALANLISETREYNEAEQARADAAMRLQEVMGVSLQQAEVMDELRKRAGKRVLQVADYERILNEELGITADVSVEVKEKTYALAGAFDAQRVAGELARFEMGNLAGAQLEVGAAADEVTPKLFGAEDIMKRYTDTLLFNVAAAHLDEEGQIRLAEKLGLVDEKTLSAYESVAILTEKYDKNEDGIISNIEKTDEYIAELDILTGRINDIPDNQVKALWYDVHETTYRHTVYTKKYVTDPAERREQLERDPRWGAHHGGSFIVPPGFSEPTNPFIVGVESGEHVQVLTRQQQIELRMGGRRRAAVNYNRVNNIYVERSAAAAWLAEQQRREEIEEIDRII
jgi:hypothetical protein